MKRALQWQQGEGVFPYLKTKLQPLLEPPPPKLPLHGDTLHIMIIMYKSYSCTWWKTAGLLKYLNSQNVTLGKKHNNKDGREKEGNKRYGDKGEKKSGEWMGKYKEGTKRKEKQQQQDFV